MGKFFCIGRNKTGTTSLLKSFQDLGFKGGIQWDGEGLLPYWEKKNWQPILEYCGTADVFQDIPFSYDETFIHLEQHFPNAKFILSIRDDANQWYDSLIRFHGKRFGRIPPTLEDVKKLPYRGNGWIYWSMQKLYKTPLNDPYNKEVLTKHYNDYNQSVLNYFEDKPNKLLVINLDEEGSYQKFCEFIGVKSPFTKFPHLNKS
jgi:hypothetical protein